jgi:hypothetical protein
MKGNAAVKRDDALIQSLTTSSGHSDTCGNPFCNSIIEPLPDGCHRRTARRYCSNPCKLDGYALRRAKALLQEVGIIRFHEFLRGV